MRTAAQLVAFILLSPPALGAERNEVAIVTVARCSEAGRVGVVSQVSFSRRMSTAERSLTEWLSFTDAVAARGTKEPCELMGKSLLDAARAYAREGRPAYAIRAYEGLLDLRVLPAFAIAGVVHEMEPLLVTMGRGELAASLAVDVLEHLSQLPARIQVRAVWDAVRLSLADSTQTDRLVKLVQTKYAEAPWAPAVTVTIDGGDESTEPLLDQETVAWIDRTATQRVEAAAHGAVALRISATDPARAEVETKLAADAWKDRAPVDPLRDGETFGIERLVASALISRADTHAADVAKELTHPRDASRFAKPDDLSAHLSELLRRIEALDAEYADLMDPEEQFSAEIRVLAASRLGNLWLTAARALEGSVKTEMKLKKSTRESYEKIRAAFANEFRAKARGVFEDCLDVARAEGFALDASLECEVGRKKTGSDAPPPLEEMVPRARFTTGVQSVLASPELLEPMQRE